jgi:class 3 adenylate cyclase
MPTPELDEIPLLLGVSEDQRRLITDSMVRFFPDGEAILTEEDEAESLVVILMGQVRIEANQVIIAHRGAFEVIGEQALIDGTRRSATVRAEGTVKALVIPSDVVANLMQDSAFAWNLLRAVSGKLREATADRAHHYEVENRLFTEFRAHLAPAVIDELLRTATVFGSPRFIDAVILFSDIRSFTEISRGMEPGEIAEALSVYFEPIVDIIHHHEGMVDKFVGDAVMAVWGYTPVAGDALEHAFECAVDMVRFARSTSFGGEPMQIGVGLNVGRVFVGNVGSESKRQFTVLGSPVNLASRYEAECKALEVPIVIGPDMAYNLPESIRANLREHPDRDIKGAGKQHLFSFDPPLPLQD